MEFYSFRIFKNDTKTEPLRKEIPIAEPEEPSFKIEVMRPKIQKPISDFIEHDVSNKIIEKSQNYKDAAYFIDFEAQDKNTVMSCDEEEEEENSEEKSLGLFDESWEDVVLPVKDAQPVEEVKSVGELAVQVRVLKISINGRKSFIFSFFLDKKLI